MTALLENLCINNWSKKKGRKSEREKGKKEEKEKGEALVILFGNIR